MKTDDIILKEVKSFGYDKYINIDEIVKKAISLTKQTEQKRISLDLEPINEIIREIEGNYKMIDNVPQHIITLIKRWRDFRKKEVRRNDR